MIQGQVSQLSHLSTKRSLIWVYKESKKSGVGARVYKETDTACFLQVSDTDFIALFASDAGYIEHFCCTLSSYDADEVAARLEAEGHSIHRVEDRVFVRDPDGLLVQVSAEEFE